MADLGRILISDDEVTFLHSTAELMRREGYEVSCAEDATVAADLLGKESFDVLIADIKMPGNSELELVREVAQRGEGMAVILVTGYPSVRTAVSSIDLSVAAYLVKPFEIGDLLTAVKQSIERHRLFQAAVEMQRRLQSWQQDLSNQQHLSLQGHGGSVAGVDSFVELALGNVAGCFADLKRLINSRTANQADVDCRGGARDLGGPGGGSDATHVNPDATASEMRKALERLANDLEELGIVTGGYTAPADLDAQKDLHNLSRREWEILRQLRAHHRVGTIARSLHLSPHTVRNHLKSIFRKLGVHSQEELLNLLQNLSQRD